MIACPKDEAALEAMLSEPSERVVDIMAGVEGDLVLLGAAGKIGVTLGVMAARARELAQKRRADAGLCPKPGRVIAVSRFSDATAREKFEDAGVKTVSCDLLDRTAVEALPESHNVIFLAGRKFGTQGAQDLTWAMNTIVPANVAERYANVRIVAYSTGCVYPYVRPETGGSLESDDPWPTGEYAQSALGRERVFEHYSRTRGTKVCLFRLNYAIDLRYGVLHDIARKILAGEAIDLSSGTFNCIWQGDVLERTFLAMELCASPAVPINVTGPETIPVRQAALALGERLGRAPVFADASDGIDEGGPVYLSNAARSFDLWGYPRMPLATMIDLTASWLASGGASLGKPTHFESTDGKY
jgi:nucleoside-diphosphate-sugar epimerase